MTFIFDENVSHHLVHLMAQLGEDVLHVNDVFGAGSLDAQMLPRIAESGWILVTMDLAMNKAKGNHGHRAILVQHRVRVLFLPAQLSQRTGWDKAARVFKSWQGIKLAQPKLKSLRGQISLSGKVEPRG